MEERLPFIAAVISGIIAWIATALFLQQYLALMTIVLILSIVLLRLNAWALVGGFLTGLALELFNRGATNQFIVILSVLAIGTGLQLAVVLIPPVNSEFRSPSSSVGQNMVFGMIGITLSYGFHFLLCKPTISVGSDLFITRILMQFGQCDASFTYSEPFIKFLSNQEFGLDVLNSLAFVCLMRFFLSQFTWVAIFASLRQINFKIFAFSTFLKHALTAYFGGLIIGGLLSLVLQIPIVVLIVILFRNIPNSQNFQDLGSLSSQLSSELETLLLISTAISISCISWGAGRGAHWV